MPSWKYEAVDRTGADVEGQVDAPSVERAVQLIRDRAQFPTKVWCVDPQPPGGGNKKPVRPIRIYTR